MSGFVKGRAEVPVKVLYPCRGRLRERRWLSAPCAAAGLVLLACQSPAPTPTPTTALTSTATRPPSPTVAPSPVAAQTPTLDATSAAAVQATFQSYMFGQG